MTHENLKGRVAVVTGGGGVLCGQFAKTLAKQGCKVAILDLNEAAAQQYADEINANGGEAIAVGCNVLDQESMQNARSIINEKLGTCDILLNGAGGNNPKGTTTKDTLEKIDLVQKDESIKTFFCINLVRLDLFGKSNSLSVCRRTGNTCVGNNSVGLFGSAFFQELTFFKRRSKRKAKIFAFQQIIGAIE